MSNKNQGCNYLLLLIIGVLLYIITIGLPVFTSLPNEIFANISGTAFISMTMGPIVGGIFVIIMNCVVSLISKNSILIIGSLILKFLEAIVIGIFNYKKRNVKKFGTTIMVLTFIIKPLAFPISFITNSSYFEDISFFSYFISSYTQFLNDNLISTLITYTFSCAISYIIIYAIKRILSKSKI